MFTSRLFSIWWQDGIKYWGEISTDTLNPDWSDTDQKTGQILFQTVFSYLLLDCFLVLILVDSVSPLQSVHLCWGLDISLSYFLYLCIRALPGVQPETSELHFYYWGLEREKATPGLGAGAVSGGRGGNPAESLITPR